MRARRRMMSVVALTMALGLVAAACGGDDDDDTASTGAPATEAPAESTAAPEPTEGSTPAESVTVGLLYDVTGRGDKSFNDAAAAGLDQAKSEFGIVPTESTPSGDADRAERLKVLVDSGNQLVIGVGFLWGEALTAGAEASPDTSFAIVDSVVDLPNVSSLVFAEEQGSYLVGVAAGLKTTSNKVGFIGGVENELIQKFEAGFVAGVKAANPDATVDVKYISQPPDFSGFNDPANGKAIAKAMYDSGIDVVYHAAGGSGQGLFEAAAESGKQPGEVWAIGVDSDQAQTVAPELAPYILTSMLKRVDVAVYETIKSFNEGAFQGGTRLFDLSVDGVGYATTGGNLDDIVDQLEAAKADIVSGKITVPTTP